MAFNSNCWMAGNSGYHVSIHRVVTLLTPDVYWMPAISHQLMIIKQIQMTRRIGITRMATNAIIFLDDSVSNKTIIRLFQIV